MCEKPALKIRNVVLISEDNVSVGKWPMARVERLVPGKDGLVRNVTLKIHKGRLRGPVQRLHRLEASTTPTVTLTVGSLPLKTSRRRWRRNKL